MYRKVIKKVNKTACDELNNIYEEKKKQPSVGQKTGFEKQNANYFK